MLFSIANTISSLLAMIIHAGLLKGILAGRSRRMLYIERSFMPQWGLECVIKAERVIKSESLNMLKYS